MNIDEALRAEVRRMSTSRRVAEGPASCVLFGTFGRSVALSELSRSYRWIRPAVVRRTLSRAEDSAREGASTSPPDGPPKLPGQPIARLLAGLALREASWIAGGVSDLLEEWRRVRRRAAPPLELYGGLAGYATLGEWLAERMEDAATHRPKLLAMARDARACLVEGLASVERVRSMGSLHFAHGLTGALYGVYATPGPIPSHVRSRLSELLAQRTEEGGYIAWPDREGGDVPNDFWGTLCNGVPGQTMLLAAVLRREPSDELRRVAELCARTTFALKRPVGGICCGIGGHALALSAYADVAKDSRARRWARTRLTQAYALPEDGPGLLVSRLGLFLLATRLRARPLSFPWLVPVAPVGTER